MKKSEAKPTRSNRFRERAQQIANVIENPAIPDEIAFRAREYVTIQLDDLWEKLDIHNPRVVRELLPLLQELCVKRSK